jgi:hypothetical protein
LSQFLIRIEILSRREGEIPTRMPIQMLSASRQIVKETTSMIQVRTKTTELSHTYIYVCMSILSPSVCTLYAYTAHFQIPFTDWRVRSVFRSRFCNYPLFQSWFTWIPPHNCHLGSCNITSVGCLSEMRRYNHHERSSHRGSGLHMRRRRHL